MLSSCDIFEVGWIVLQLIDFLLQSSVFLFKLSRLFLESFEFGTLFP